MRLVITISLVVFGVGCSAQQARPEAPISMDDPSWTPPGQLNFAISERAVNDVSATPKARSAESLARPNHREIASHGKVHAAR